MEIIVYLLIAVFLFVSFVLYEIFKNIRRKKKTPKPPVVAPKTDTHISNIKPKNRDLVFQNPTSNIREIGSAENESSFTVSESFAKESDNINKNVLIAEDNDGNYILLNIFLRKYFNVERAKTGKQAVEMHRKKRYDLILMDISLPEMSGKEAFTEIRAFDKNVPIIAQTAYAYEYEKEEAITFGFNLFLAKPIKRDELYNGIRSLNFNINTN